MSVLYRNPQHTWKGHFSVWTVWPDVHVKHHCWWLKPYYCWNMTTPQKLESDQATAKHITNSNGNNTGTNQLHGKKPFQGGKKQKCGNHQGNKTGEHLANSPQQQQQHQQQPQCQGGKPPFKWWHQGQDQHVQKGQHQQKPNNYQKRSIIDPSICMKCSDTQHRPGFTCPASRYQYKKCKKFGHFTKSCLSTMASVNEHNLDLTGEAAHRQKINTLNASKGTFYICNVKAPKPKSKYMQTSKSMAETITSTPEWILQQMSTCYQQQGTHKSMRTQI